MASNVTPVTLKIDGFADREILSVKYKFERKTDLEGQLAGIPRGGLIDITVKALNDGNNQLIGWMLDPTLPKDVKIEFVNTVDGKAEKTLEGKNCYCIHYNETWEEGVGDQETITIVCQEFKNGGASFVNDWK
ncbi:MAG: hypothetical protein MJY43_05180 [Bacteroidales bacterium]|nr:hypothetical protein [Bacteroidales bacterium]